MGRPVAAPTIFRLSHGVSGGLREFFGCSGSFDDCTPGPIFDAVRIRQGSFLLRRV